MARTVARTVLSGGRVFDGTGSAIADADVVISDGKIVDVGIGLDGDEQVDVSGLTVLPGFIDCHVHVMVSGIDLVRRLQRPFSYQFFQAAANLAATLDCGITTVRDAGGADLGVQRAVADGLVDGPRMQISISALSQTGGHGDGWLPSGMTTFLLTPHPGRPAGPGRRARGECASGCARSSAPAPTSSRCIRQVACCRPATIRSTLSSGPTNSPP